MKKIRNISFRYKITLIFAIICTFSTVISGILYYNFSQREIVDNFTENAKSLVSQLENTLDTRLEAVNRKAFAALTNQSFTQPLSDYLSAPTLEKNVKLSGEAAYWLKDISIAEPLIHSTFLYSKEQSWDDYTRTRNWEFEFETSEFAAYVQNNPQTSVFWLPTMKDVIFKDDDKVIPYVRKFQGGQSRIPVYLIIQVNKTVLEEEILGDVKNLGEIIITDSEGNYIAGTMNTFPKKLGDAIPKEETLKTVEETLTYNGEEYLLYRGNVSVNNWNIYILKSKSKLLESVRDLRKLIVEMTILMISICLILVIVLARQLTLSLKRLSVQINRMRNGELNARYYYPYKDEIGSLATNFNYMADQIEKSMQKQEEYIVILKEERNFVEQIQKQKRKAELKALQAQINPHFLYNTLNTITWLASDRGVDEIRILSNALGKFFRISLSKGAEVITLEDEIEHVKSYLAIQGIRYAEVMSYEIEVPEELLKCKILKLVLQPLVENAIYHGVKEKVGMRRIRIYCENQVREKGDNVIQIVVEDDGRGIEEQKLAAINQALQEGNTNQTDGYGIFNVNERIKLYYGETYGLYYESVENEWTRAILNIPRVV